MVTLKQLTMHCENHLCLAVTVRSVDPIFYDMSLFKVNKGWFRNMDLPLRRRITAIYNNIDSAYITFAREHHCDIQQVTLKADDQ